ncbi:hypothetical protein GCK72_020904 [Caenorhabditis remanei]|uniref:DUF38 domain-containing protein n=1 Tax=Caenorhabditis remanei TaxID=31234 RepID=A0A6A5GHT2_CAERE|nr:hypothetical protein GCK72_020904 [Caenorhabditis remanei]KAF1754344.1 hypothetical protein GCK72_020904 [Caenorhabditis remanei]
MFRSKPLAYQSAKAVLEYISFEKRKHFYAMCPAIRKMEEILPYHLELVSLWSMAQDHIITGIDSFGFSFWDNEGNQIRMNNHSKRKFVDQFTCLGPEQAVEKFFLYNLNREGTRIKNVELNKAPEFISKCIPIAIKNMTVFKTDAWFPTNIPIENVEVDTTLREDALKIPKHVTVRIPVYVATRINAEIVSEWNCESIKIDSPMQSEVIAYYCNKVSKRTNRPIGSRLMARHSLPVKFVHDILYSKMNARKTMLNGRECATISIDESTELNVYCSTDDHYFVVVEVCAKGTAIEVFLHFSMMHGLYWK